MKNKAEEEIEMLKSDAGFMAWLNDFQERNCRGCIHATLGPIAKGELCCEFFYTEEEDNRCLDRE